MAAPSFVQLGTTAVQTGGSISSGYGTATVGNVIIIQAVADGTASSSFDNTPISISGLADLAGGTTKLTYIGGFDVGSPVAARHYLLIGRATATTVSYNVAPDAGTDDCYCAFYEFSGVHAGTTLANVIENSSAGSAVNGVGTSITIADTGVTTLGADRLACNFVGVNDDNVLDAFTGETGGDWTEAAAEFASATGTDAAIGLQIATIASAGTINGGTDGMAASDAWGVVGFALIGTTVATASSLLLRNRNRILVRR